MNEMQNLYIGQRVRLIGTYLTDFVKIGHEGEIVKLPSDLTDPDELMSVKWDNEIGEEEWFIGWVRIKPFDDHHLYSFNGGLELIESQPNEWLDRYEVV